VNASIIGQTHPSPTPAKATGATPEHAPPPATTPEPAIDLAVEIGGREGPEPTRFGDWEKNGRCIDF
jgi:hypothetical protein